MPTSRTTKAVEVNSREGGVYLWRAPAALARRRVSPYRPIAVLFSQFDRHARTSLHVYTRRRILLLVPALIELALSLSSTSRFVCFLSTPYRIYVAGDIGLIN